MFKDEALVNNTKFTMSLLHLCWKEARLQQSACLLYQSSSLEEVFLKLEVEVETRRLSMTGPNYLLRCWGTATTDRAVEQLQCTMVEACSCI